MRFKQEHPPTNDYCFTTALKMCFISRGGKTIIAPVEVEGGVQGTEELNR